MIRVVDYGVGNVQAFLAVYKSLGIPAAAARTAQDLAGGTHLILPGVGAFDHAMRMFDRSGMRPTMEDMVLRRGVPVLGVCVGMQMLAGGSDEGVRPGLNWIPGSVRAFASHAKSRSLPLPHMGWNDLCVNGRNPLFQYLEPEPRFYFLHSFYFDCQSAGHVAAITEYGFRFPSVVSAGNVHGVQCHPEKSHRFGAQLLKSFAEL